MRSMRSNAAISQSHRPRKEIRMIFHETRLGDAWLIELEPRGDERGMFARAMCREEFGERGLLTDYVQQNISLSADKGTVRGMRSEEHTSELQSLMRISSAVFCWKQKHHSTIEV